jgi:thiopeptide-type bacteriocin biosynthesis protein
MGKANNHRFKASEWVAYHIFSHSRPGDEVLLGVVLPVVRDLWDRRRFVRFFFIRYGEGGPHIRLRFLCPSEAREDIEATLKRRVTEFFSQGDGPDLSDRMIQHPFEPETERYGGAELLGQSLDFFCLTSAYVLRQIELHHGVPKSRLLALSMRALVRQALGFAADEDELSRLVAYAVNRESRSRSPLEERADWEFAARQEDYVRLLAEEIAFFLDSRARSRLTDTMLADGALLLKQGTRGASGPARWRILSSQLHMTWNRIGLQNLEESYLGRILWRAVRHLIDSKDGLRSSLAVALAQPRIQCKGGLETLIPKGIAQLARPHGAGAPELRIRKANE